MPSTVGLPLQVVYWCLHRSRRSDWEKRGKDTINEYGHAGTLASSR
jgi:hypothetical protein